MLRADSASSVLAHCPAIALGVNHDAKWSCVAPSSRRSSAPPSSSCSSAPTRAASRACVGTAAADASSM
eukprot:scaffold33603_cov75-Phaeocystis_antarctica.AAC.3